MANNREVILSIGLSKEIYEGLLNEAHKNKIFNLKHDLKRKERKPDNLNAIIRDTLEKAFVKN